MAFIAGAIIGGGLISAVGGLIASGNASNAATNAANIQANAANNAAAMQGAMYGQTRNDLLPFQNVGRSAIGTMNGLIPGGLQTSNPAMPSTQFGGGQGSPQLSGVDENGRPVYTNTGPAAPQAGGYFSGATGGTTPAGGTPGPTGPGTASPAIAQIPSDPNSPAGAPSPVGAPGQSPFLTAAEQNIPQLGGVAQNSLASFTPGSGNNPLQSAMYSYVNGASNTPNPLLAAANNSILGASATPNSALSNLNSFTNPMSNPSLAKLNNLLGLDSSDPGARQAALEATPGYKFTLDQGLKATQNGFAAQGLGNSGAAMKGAAQFATGLADQTYQSQLNNYLTNYNSQFTNAYNLYNSTATQGLNAFGQQSNLAQNTYNQSFNNALNMTGQQFNNAQTGYQNQVGNAYNLLTLGANAGAQTGTAGVQAASNAGGYVTSGAAAQAGGIVGSANALNNGITGITGNISQLATMYGMNPSLFKGAGTAGGNSLSVGGMTAAGNTSGIYA